MSDGIGLAEALLGLDGFRVLEVGETPDELVIAVETTATVAWCSACGVRAEAHDRMPIEIRDLPCFGRPARLVWRKRRWRCRENACGARTWTETSLHFDAQRIITRRAGMEERFRPDLERIGRGRELTGEDRREGDQEEQDQADQAVAAGDEETPRLAQLRARARRERRGGGVETVGAEGGGLHQRNRIRGSSIA